MKAAPKAPELIAVDSHVPPPFTRGHALAYPFWDMRPGDSFKVDCTDDTRELARLSSRIGTAARKFARRINNGKLRFVTRTVREDDKVGVRCWRTK